MELWSADIDPLLTESARHLSQCDVHIIVLEHAYGEYVAGQQISFTEWEYHQSLNKRTILAFLLHDADFAAEHARVVEADLQRD